MKTLMGLAFMYGFICIGSPSGLGADQSGVNLLPNPSFEEGEHEDRLPVGWRPWQDGLCSVFVWDKTSARTGQRSLYVCNADRDNSAAWISSCPVKPETAYRFSAWIKVRKGAGRGITLLRARGRAKGMDKKWEAGSEGRSETGSQWQLLEWNFTTPPGLESAAFWLWNVHGRGDQVWFDDVELKEIPKPR